MTCQTDAWMDRPVTPLFVPAKTGADVETQIMPGDLFNFDQEVKVSSFLTRPFLTPLKPILEVIVGKTMEQSMLEVMEEEELENLREQQRKFQVRKASMKYIINRLTRKHENANNVQHSDSRSKSFD